MDSTSNKKSILMFPWLGHGHISPFLELAKRLTERNFIIYLCSTPANLVSIKQKIGDKYLLSIRPIKLHLPSLPDLPPNMHTTNGLPPQLMPTLKKALDLAKPNFVKILETLRPDLLIYDLIQPWAPIAASELEIPAVVFIATSATMASSMFHLYSKRHVKFPFPSIYYRDYEGHHEKLLFESSGNQIKDMDRVKRGVKRSSNIVLIKSVKEIEAKYGEYLGSLTGKKVIQVGPLVQDPVDESLDADYNVIEWLDSKAKGSTVFVSFGSEYFLSDHELEEVAYGLELSNVNFVWVIRFPNGGLKKIKAVEKLPIGFLDRVSDRGMIIDGWAPQTRILAHSSIGGFVSHCGWSSCMESMKIGVPIIAMPMHLDQPINARLVEEVGVGMEVVRSKEGRLDRRVVAEVVKNVVVDKVGESVRKKAKIISEHMRIKGDDEIDEVVVELVKLIGRSKKGRLDQKVVKNVVVDKIGEGVRKKAMIISEHMGMKGEEEIDEVVVELVNLLGFESSKLELI